MKYERSITLIFFTLLIAMLNVFINLIIDLIYGLADPRIRLD